MIQLLCMCCCKVLVSDTQDAPPPTGNASAGTSRSLGESWRTATTSTAASAPLSQVQP